eukprot:Hpha_TRINITY_DN15973_c0_g5::TRINITY_DN15973_c0_g5_i1::g.74579::m.74579/K06158/ABCF3; ATP-binding cassette, subfamily F, member 3
MVRKKVGAGTAEAEAAASGRDFGEYELEELFVQGEFNQSMVAVVKGGVGVERLTQMDRPVVEYLMNILDAQRSAESASPEDTVSAAWATFLVQFGCFPTEEQARKVTDALLVMLREKFLIVDVSKEDKKRLLKAPVQMGKLAEQQLRQTKITNAMSGIGGAAVNYNESNVDWDGKAEQAKNARRERKEREKQEALKNEYEEFMRKRGLSGQTHVKIHGNTKFPNGGEIKLDGVHINMGKTVLLRAAPLHILAGKRYGMIGRNGVGKTTLLRHIAEGELEGISPFLQILHIEQECVGTAQTPIQVVLSADVERQNLLDEESELLAREDSESADVGRRLAEIYDRMEEIEAHSAESRAAAILSGLSFDAQMMHCPTKNLSGGWRMRVSLARSLFVSPDILLLDEPTNHLDLHAVLWLEHYLSTWDKTLLVVSHSRTFLNAVCTDIVDYRDMDLKYYRGNYDMFEGTRAELLRTQGKQHEAQEKQRAHMQSFIDRFRCNAKRASMVQSRIKAMEKMSSVAAVVQDAAFSFQFPTPEMVPNPYMQIVDVTFGYQKEKILFRDVNFSLDMDSRVALVGDNGSGKSTFLNVIAGDLEPMDGRAIKNPKARIARFTQHHVDSLNLQRTPLEQMMATFPNAEKDALRAHLGKLGLSGEKAVQPIYTLSGGQKSRIAFSILTWTCPHLLLLDEPTNHLDIDTVDALIMALNDYKGGVMIISHDEHLIKSACDEIWVCGGGRLKKWDGDFDSYKKSLHIKF